MKKRIVLNILLCFAAVNILFAGDVFWTGGGAPGDWEDPANWSSNPDLPDEGDDVHIIGAYTVSLASNRTIEALRLGNGAHLIIASGKTLNVFDNGSDGVRIENTGGTLTVNGTLNSYDHNGVGVKIDSVGAVMTINGTLNSYDNNKDGIELDGPGSSMTVNGTLNIYDNSKDGIKVDNGNTLFISSTGKIYINNVGNDGLDLDEDVTNEGLISITNHGEIGINTGGSGYFVNNGLITITGGTFGIDGKGSTWFFTNNNFLTVSGADTLVDDGTNISNYGTFTCDGYLENGNNNDVDFKPGSILEPGPSIGKISFTDILDLTGVNLNIEINGASNYDQIEIDTGIHGPADLTLSNAVLNLSGSYTPAPGDEFMIIEKIHPDPIDGTFSGLPEGATFMYKGVELTISYVGGDGNDMTVSNLAPLPIELIDFDARALKNEVKLAWVTATETNNDFFTIERSIDGRSFEAIAKVYGNGNTTEISKYTFMDEKPENGVSYYRLKQTDFDGQFSYSDIKQVDFQKENTIKVYPTLVVNEILNIEGNTSSKNSMTVSIIDLNGQVVKSSDISKNEHKKEISVSDLFPGMYFITIQNGDTVQTNKFIKL